MAMSLWDHHLRLRDLEIAVTVLLEALRRGRPEFGTNVDEAVRKLRSQGEKGAIALLEGEPARAPYRRSA
jgi:hypothetical protein